MSKTSKNPDFDKKTLIIFILLVIFIAGTAFYAAYAWQQRKVDSLRNLVEPLSSHSENTEAHDDTENSPAENTPYYSYTSDKDARVLVYAPARDATISNPVGIIGEIPPGWAFEAEFPVELKNSAGKVIAEASATALGDWQKDDHVPFSVQFLYEGEQSGTGTIVIHKANASDLAEHNDSVTIPVKF